jgi:ribonuclease D
MNYIITKDRQVFEKVGNYNYCNLEDMLLPGKIAVDTETTYLHVHLGAYMFCIQIGTGKNNYIIDLEHRDTPLISGKQIFFKELQPYLEDKILVFHNAAFDLRFLYSEGFYPEEVRDTMVASRALYNGKDGIFSHSFDAVMKREMGTVYDKSEQKTINKIRLTTDRNIKYSFDDTWTVGPLRNTSRIHCDVARAKIINSFRTVMNSSSQILIFNVSRYTCSAVSRALPGL